MLRTTERECQQDHVVSLYDVLIAHSNSVKFQNSKHKTSVLTKASYHAAEEREGFEQHSRQIKGKDCFELKTRVGCTWYANSCCDECDSLPRLS